MPLPNDALELAKPRTALTAAENHIRGAMALIRPSNPEAWIKLDASLARLQGLAFFLDVSADADITNESA